MLYQHYNIGIEIPEKTTETRRSYSATTRWCIVHGSLWYSQPSMDLYSDLSEAKDNVLLSSLMIMQLSKWLQSRWCKYTFIQECVHDYMQVECIINNPMKLVALNHVNLYTHNMCIYIHRLNCTSSSLAVQIEIHVWLYHIKPCILHHLVVAE